MRLLIELLILGICLTAINAQINSATGLTPQSCNKKKSLAIIKKLEIADCKSYPCTLERGTNASLRIQLQPTQRINNLKLSIHGIIGGKEVPFSADDVQHCKNTIKGASCPLVRNKVYNYVNQMHVSKQYPAISVTVRYNILDQNGRQVACFQWPAKIV